MIKCLFLKHNTSPSNFNYIYIVLLSQLHCDSYVQDLRMAKQKALLMDIFSEVQKKSYCVKKVCLKIMCCTIILLTARKGAAFFQVGLLE